MIIWFQENGWMNADLMKRYVDYLNDIRIKNRTSKTLVLVYNSFKEYLKESIKLKFYENALIWQ